MRDFLITTLWTLAAGVCCVFSVWLILHFIHALERIYCAVHAWGGNWAVAIVFCFIFAPLFALMYIYEKKWGNDDFYY